MNAARYLSLSDTSIHLHTCTAGPEFSLSLCIIRLSSGFLTLWNWCLSQLLSPHAESMASGRRISARRRAHVGSAWVARGCAALAGNCLKRNYKTEAVSLPTLCHPPSLETTKRGREQEVSEHMCEGPIPVERDSQRESITGIVNFGIC